MLVGRDRECGQIDGLLDGARRGRSGVLVLRGEPGIGKSTLCAYAVDRAEGLTVVRAQGIESEAELPFAALADLLRPLVGRLADIPAPQAAALDAETQRGLVIAAASGSTDFHSISAAIAGAGIDPAALDAAERAGLVVVDGNRFDFQHPLLRSAVYHSAPAALRRAAHEAVAQGLGSDTRAWHLAAAAPEPDARVAAELKETALAARARGGHAEAAAALEQAARLTIDSEERARLLRSAADEMRRSGQAARSLALLDEALAATTSPRLRARIQHLRGVVEMWRGAPLAAYEHLIDDAARIEQDDPAKAAWMLSDAGWACFMGGDIAAGRAASERAFALTEGTGGLAQILATALLGIALLLSGERERAEPLLRRYEPMLDDTEFLGRSYAVVWPAAQALVW